MKYIMKYSFIIHASEIHCDMFTLYIYIMKYIVIYMCYIHYKIHVMYMRIAYIMKFENPYGFN